MMALFTVQNGDWGSDAVQDKFIEEYFHKTPVSCNSGSGKSKKRKLSEGGISTEVCLGGNNHNGVRKKKKHKRISDKTSSSACEFQEGTYSSEYFKTVKTTSAEHQNVHNLNLETKKKKKKKRDMKHGIQVRGKVENAFSNNNLTEMAEISSKSSIMHNEGLYGKHPPSKKKRGNKLQTYSSAVNKNLNMSNEKYLSHSDIHANETEFVEESSESNSFRNQQSALFREKMLKAVQAAKFRLLNEKMYTETGFSALKFFRNDKDSFHAYHQGYQSQVNKWPVNPVDLIIKDLHQLPKNLIVADLGCGDAKVARTFPNKRVHSFDLVALNDHVTCCDISKVPLADGFVDIAIFCLSLMGTNLNDFVSEAHRILKLRGLLKIAEVESRFDDLSTFIKNVEAHGFVLINKDVSHKMFVLLDFNKVKRNLKKNDLPVITLKPCLYKRR